MCPIQLFCYSTTLLNSILLYLHLHLHLYFYLYPLLRYFTLLRVEGRKVVRVELRTNTLYRKLDCKQSGVACGYTRVDNFVGWNGILRMNECE